MTPWESTVAGLRWASVVMPPRLMDSALDFQQDVGAQDPMLASGTQGTLGVLQERSGRKKRLPECRAVDSLVAY